MNKKQLIVGWVKSFIPTFKKSYCPRCGADITNMTSIATDFSSDTDRVCPCCGKKIHLPLSPMYWKTRLPIAFAVAIIMVVLTLIFGVLALISGK